LNKEHHWASVTRSSVNDTQIDDRPSLNLDSNTVGIEFDHGQVSSSAGCGHYR
jgi:hypothetical protein